MKNIIVLFGWTLYIVLNVSVAIPAEIKMDIEYSKTFTSVEMKKEPIEFAEAEAIKNPKDYRYHYLLGVLYVPENFSLAKKEFNEAVRINPNHFASYMNLGYIGQSENANSEETIWYFKKAIECAPENPVGYNSLATVYLGYGKAEKAYEILEKAIDKIKNEESLYVNQSMILLNNYNGKSEQAKIIRNMERSLLLSKKDIYYLLLGTYYLRVGSNEEAKKLFEKAVDLNPKNIINRLSLSTAYKNLNKYEEAISIAKEALKVEPINEIVLQEIREYEQEYEVWKKNHLPKNK